jgi:hypothetical protein
MLRMLQLKMADFRCFSFTSATRRDIERDMKLTSDKLEVSEVRPRPTMTEIKCGQLDALPLFASDLECA